MCIISSKITYTSNVHRSWLPNFGASTFWEPKWKCTVRSKDLWVCMTVWEYFTSSTPAPTLNKPSHLLIAKQFQPLSSYILSQTQSKTESGLIHPENEWGVTYNQPNNSSVDPDLEGLGGCVSLCFPSTLHLNLKINACTRPGPGRPLCKAHTAFWPHLVSIIPDSIHNVKSVDSATAAVWSTAFQAPQALWKIFIMEAVQVLFQIARVFPFQSTNSSQRAQRPSCFYFMVCTEMTSVKLSHHEHTVFWRTKRPLLYFLDCFSAWTFKAPHVITWHVNNESNATWQRPHTVME